MSDVRDKLAEIIRDAVIDGQNDDDYILTIADAILREFPELRQRDLATESAMDVIRRLNHAAL